MIINAVVLEYPTVACHIMTIRLLEEVPAAMNVFL